MPTARLQVSRASARFIRQGHPWLRPDRFTRGLERLQHGQVANLIDDQGKPLASALIDREHAGICARVFHRRPDRDFDPIAAMNRAWQQRQALHADPDTDAYRIVHGEADFLPGVRLERYGDCLVLLLQAPCLRPWRERLAAAAQALLPDATVVLREQYNDLRASELRSQRLDGQALHPEQAVCCRELGVHWQALPFDGLATGIYVDQRATRAWLRPHCHDQRVLNLFAYTGLFSVSLLAAGAASAVDVDLAAPALAHAQAMAALNLVTERHRSVQQDCLRFLREEHEQFDIIIVDPPTAAQGGGRGWIARRDYPELIRAAWPRLAPHGLLLLISNTIGKPVPLERILRQAAPQAHMLPTPELGADLPQLSGFPEGRPFSLLAARR